MLHSTKDQPQYNLVPNLSKQDDLVQDDLAQDNMDRDSSEIEKKSKNNMLGMIFVTSSTFLLISADAIFKYGSNNLNASLFQCIIISDFIQHSFAWIFWFLPSSITQKSEYHKSWYGEKGNILNICLRGFFYWCDSYFYWRGISILPLGDAESIYFLSPIFVAFGARIFLKETFSKTFPIIFILTIIGLLILCQPRFLTKSITFNKNNNQHDSKYYNSSDINIWGIISLIIGCIAWSLMSLMVRITPTAHWIQLELVSSFQTFAIWTPILLFINQFIKNDFNLDNNGEWSLSINIIIICIIMGILSIFALMFLVLGYQYGEATKVSWMEYMNVPIGYLYQWIIFNQPPNIYETIGALIIFSTCIIEAVEEYYNYKNARKELEKTRVEKLVN